MIGLEALFDVVVALLLVVVALESLHTPNLFTGVAFFIVYGLVLALAWVRLEAPDLALAEAAVGAGLTGVLLLDAAREITVRRRTRAAPRRRLPYVALPALVVLAALVAAVVALPERAPGLGPHVAAALPESGVDHPVTAVLLAFRALDTWLETAVLLLAVAGVIILQRAQHFRIMPREREGSPLLAALVRVLLPIVVVFAGYLLWAGTSGPGGAFQAGVLLGAGGILLELAGITTLSRLGDRARVALLVLGVAGFAIASGAMLLRGAPLLRLPDDAAGSVIVALEVAIAVSVAASVVALMLASNLRLAHAVTEEERG